ncbi:hypothetical protein Thein_1738 [Thermodesulfatator indicus DSM 15286]|uniref:Uncharacterized protein n=1 Tax=Thermodesulfatator indicus (strain DSM 15286 / JCM 11887 / CIR29812) TaxID=667014 RepID=F8ABJ9_THEID|nr:hypothetical protein Thein_1738 [Thermodesulfatator indicus DSM 15286]
MRGEKLLRAIGHLLSATGYPVTARRTSPSLRAKRSSPCPERSEGIFEIAMATVSPRDKDCFGASPLAMTMMENSFAMTMNNNDGEQPLNETLTVTARSRPSSVTARRHEVPTKQSLRLLRLLLQPRNNDMEGGTGLTLTEKNTRKGGT